LAQKYADELNKMLEELATDKLDVALLLKKAALYHENFIEEVREELYL
jgi:hypothetical protein